MRSFAVHTRIMGCNMFGAIPWRLRATIRGGDGDRGPPYQAHCSCSRNHLRPSIDVQAETTFYFVSGGTRGHANRRSKPLSVRMCASAEAARCDVPEGGAMRFRSEVE